MTEVKRTLKSSGVISRHLNDMLLLSSQLEKKNSPNEVKRKPIKQPKVARSLSPEHIRSPPRPISPPNLNEKKKSIPKNSSPDEIVSFGIEDSTILYQRLETNFDELETENDEGLIKKKVIGTWRSYTKERAILRFAKKMAIFSWGEKVKLTSIFKWKNFVIETRELKKRSQLMRKAIYKPSYELERVQFLSSYHKFNEQLKLMKNDLKIIKNSRPKYEFKQDLFSPKFAADKAFLKKKENPEIPLKKNIKQKDPILKKDSNENIKLGKSLVPNKIQKHSSSKSLTQKAFVENSNWFEPYLQKKEFEDEECDSLSNQEKINCMKKYFMRWLSQYMYAINIYRNYHLKKTFNSWAYFLQLKFKRANDFFLKKSLNRWILLYKSPKSEYKAYYLKKSFKAWVKFKKLSKSQYKQYYLKKHFFKWIEFLQLKANKLLANINATSFYHKHLLSRTFKALYPKEYTIKEIMASNHWHSRLKIHYFYQLKKFYLKSRSIKMMHHITENLIKKVLRKWKCLSDLYSQRMKEMDSYYLKELAHNCFDSWSEWVLQEKIVRTLKKQRIFRAWKYTSHYLLKELPNKWKLHSLKRKVFVALKKYYIKKKKAFKGIKWRKEKEIRQNEKRKKIVLAAFLHNLILSKKLRSFRSRLCKKKVLNLLKKFHALMKKNNHVLALKAKKEGLINTNLKKIVFIGFLNNHLSQKAKKDSLLLALGSLSKRLKRDYFHKWAIKSGESLASLRSSLNSIFRSLDSSLKKSYKQTLFDELPRESFITSSKKLETQKFDWIDKLKNQEMSQRKLLEKKIETLKNFQI
ncbi:unnamed protein product [Blepharisma stoltei]|uniref:Sfi1 spindle body domain-containing protein n=1 Tax=Blepharisma stoltei TaxID=1481888 RepID=A0AAU9K9Y5_9CILI|nr:unnamed protein product [Blepharisma stoltei]